MKVRLILTVAVMLLAAMLLINLVLITLWKRDIVQRESERDQALLSCVQPQFLAMPATLPHVPQLAGETFAFRIGDKTMPDNIPIPLAAALDEAAAGRPVSHALFSLTELLQGSQPLLISALPLIKADKAVGAVAVSRSLQSGFETLWRAERIILIYITVNALALSAVFFFRMVSLIVRPIERLAQLARQHSGQEADWFSNDDSGGEFNQLASSLNNMLVRIEHDRQTLRATVAELEAANRQLHERQAELIRAEKLAAAGRLAAGLAHEIGNPLAVIQGYLDLLARSGQNEENSDFIRRAVAELERVTRLVRQLLDCARASKGKPEDIALHTLLAEVAELVRVQKAFRQIELVVRAEAAQDSVHADPDQLRQVLLNCLFNSADAISSAGRADGAITLATDQPEPGLLRLQIEDNGSGVSAEQLAIVFDPFFTTKEPGRGTGLGLSVSRSIVEAAGGSMTMESRAGQGSTVIIRLPLAKGGGGNG
jgi:hypothetical protein